MKVYTGIGSRRAPVDMLQLAEMVAEMLAAQGWVLRSGHAPGMDQAFEGGAGGRAEVYLPWPSFEKDVPVQGTVIDRPSLMAYSLTESYHPNWAHLKRPVRALMARNAQQVMGRDLRQPAQFVLCWTPDGSLDGEGPDTGGTGQALRIAYAHGIPIYNLAREEHYDRLSAAVA